MRYICYAILIACTFATPVQGGQPVDDAAAAKIFADSPNQIPLQHFEKLRLHVVPGKYLRQEVAVRKQLQQQPGDKDLALKLAGIERMKANGQAAPIGVFLSQRKFRLDQPAYAYFVVRNTTSKPLELDMRLDLHEGDQTLNSCSIDLHRTGPGEATGLVKQLSVKEWRCGGPALIRLKAGGVHCVRADLRKLGATSTGRYTLRWKRQDISSRVVHFEMLPVVKTTQDRLRRSIHVAKITTAPQRRAMNITGRVPNPPPPPRIAPAALEHVEAGRFAATLATGVAGKVFPDMLDLPSSDKFITATTTLEKYPGETQRRKLILSLTPKQHNRGLFLESHKHLYLIATSTSPQQLRQLEQPSELKQLEAVVSQKLSDPATPLKIEVELPKNWSQQLGVASKIKLRVLISSERLKLQGGHRLIEALMMKENFADQQPWRGLLCTPAIQMTVDSQSGE